MELRIIPYHTNLYPLQGILIKSKSVNDWADEINSLGFAISEITVYPIPDDKPNSVWGCLVIFKHNDKIFDIGKNNFCQLFKDKLFIPENSQLYPEISEEEINRLCPDNQYIFHPDFGFFSLTEPLNWIDLIVIPKKSYALIHEPANSVFIPSGKINSFQIKPIPPEEILKKPGKRKFSREKIL